MLKHKGKKITDKAVHEAHILYGYTLKDIAKYFDVHYTTISRAVKKVEEKHEK
jgi:transposase